MVNCSQPQPHPPVPFDPRSPAFRANPYPTYDWLRSHHPIFYRPDHNDWVLTRYADVAKVLTDPACGRATAAPLAEPPSHPFLAIRQECQQLMQLWLVLRNPPDHTRIRQVLRQPFTPARVQRLRSHIETQVERLLEQAPPNLDLINDLAYPLALSLNCKILGLPNADWHPQFKQWTAALAVLADLDVAPMANERGLLAIAGLAEYFRDWIRRCRRLRQPQDHLIGQLITATDNGQLSEDELLSSCIFMFTVGHSSTANLLGNCVLTLLNHPHQWQQLQANPRHLKHAIAEVLRYESPVQGVARTTIAEIQLGTHTIPAGQVLNCLIAAANRDPAQFMRPHDFNIQRHPNPYLSFGQGMHICIGMHLAKLVTEIALSALLQKFPDLALASPTFLEWDDSFLGRGLKALPVIAQPTHRPAVPVGSL